MAKQFIYAPANEIKLTQVKTFNPDYNSLPFDYRQPKIPYFYKKQLGDVTYMQCLSDWVPSLKLINYLGQVIQTISPSTPVTSIIDQTFTCYEFQVNWGEYPAGIYTLEIHYTDDDTIQQVWRSEFIETAQKWPQTLLIQYNHSFNKYSIIWSTGIVMQLRIEGNIEDYTPAFDDVIYNDQEYNTTKLNSIPRREFTLYLGSNRGFQGIPNWIADIANWAFACDQIQIDGVYYQNTNGSKWEVKRTDPNGTNFIGLKLPIIEVNNLFLNTYDTGDIPAGALQVVTNSKIYKNNSANLTIAGIFKTYSILTKIYIWNKGGDVFTATLSNNSDGSNPISIFTTTGQSREVWVVEDGYIGSQTLYILGLAGTNCDIGIVWEQLDAPAILPPVSGKPFVVGTRYTYEEINPGDFETNWNIGTGVGNTGTPYEGCVLSGTNGTMDMKGLVEIGWDKTQPATRDTVVGANGNLLTLTKPNMPSLPATFFRDRKGGNSGVDVLGVSDSGHGTFTIDVGGTAVPIDITPNGRISVRFVCITN